ncbi:hypothetical protein [Sphingomonas qomolangmaensis]|uniref:Uncharacterized protein n=1 Tax=Sphingomonas qomolangmaensis TaxID=2918765 RepID=A0ABY5L5J3_9SPHN|nr:hypothetical protein [Sphingomonas qomolangmaensis]UUL82224.1 hypothetical protein NMP03_13705 [Sphingomonas qomolangmaensis]
MADLKLSFSRLEAVLITYFRIDPERAGTFRARIKQLQRLNFPSGVNVGRGTKFDYELTHCLKLILSFELMARGLPAKFVTDMIEASWPRLQVGFQLVPNPNLGADRDDIFAVINSDLIGDGYKPEESIWIYDFDKLQSFILESKRDNAALVSINLCTVLNRLMDQLSLIRANNLMLYWEIRAWQTELPALYAESWFNDWIKVSLTVLSSFEKKADDQHP